MIKENHLKVEGAELTSGFYGDVFVRKGGTIHITEEITVLCPRG